MKTWHFENAVAIVVLASTAMLAGNTWIEWLGAAAVFCGFCHGSIAERLREREAARPVASVECHRLLGWYFVGREVLWTTYFVALGAWSAIAGCVLFAAYPVWRKFWRKRHPLNEQGSA